MLRHREDVLVPPSAQVHQDDLILAHLRRELARAESEDNSLTVFKADIDNFSRVNEIHGHMAGDSALRELARRIQAVGRLYDAVGRFGGEEFLILAPGFDDTTAATQAQRLRACVGEEAVDLTEGLVRLTVSLGVVTLVGGMAVEPDGVLYAVDLALSRAKSQGGDRVEVAERQDLFSARTDAQAHRTRTRYGSRFVA